MLKYILSLTFIAVVTLVYLFESENFQKIPQATEIYYESTIVIKDLQRREDILSTAAGTFNLATMSSAITTEALKAFSDSTESSLPLLAQWNVGIPEFVEAMDPMYMISRIELGEHVLVSWKLDPYYNDSISSSYYEDSIKKAAELNLPLVFVLPAPESALTKDSYYFTLENTTNPNVITTAGDVLEKLSPFGADELWNEVGEQWSSTSLMAQLQEWYPNPPLVVFISEDEAAKLSWSQLSQESRYTTSGDDNFKRTLVGVEWIEKYRQMHDGFKKGFVNTTWKENVKFMSYNKFSQNLEESNWLENATLTNHYMNIWPLTADGATVDFILSGSKTDNSVDAPHVLANNLPFMLNEAKLLNPNFTYQLSLNALSKVTEPAKYRGLTQFALWFLRPSIIRQASQESDREALTPLFQELADSVELIHFNEQLASFWREGSLVNSGESDLNQNIPEQYLNDPRWFLLEIDANPPRPWANSTEIPVWAFALERGKAPNREWLVYVQSPEGVMNNVTVTIPKYKDVIVDSSVKGTFSTLTEKEPVSQTQVISNNEAVIEKILNNTDIKELKTTFSDSLIKTVHKDITMTVPNKDRKSWDILQVYFKSYGISTEIVIIDTKTDEIKKVKLDGYGNWHNASHVVAPNGKLYILTNGKPNTRFILNIYDPEINKLTLNAVELPLNLSGETHPMTLGTDGNIYIGGAFYGSGKAQLIKIDPNTNEVTDFGEMGPSHKPSGVWGYHICSDDRYTYVTSGKIPWYVISYNRNTNSQTLLMESEKVTTLKQYKYGCSVTNKGIFYYLHNNELVEASRREITEAPWLIPSDETHKESIKLTLESSLLPTPPEVVSDSAEVDSDGNAEIWIKLNDIWKSYKYRVDTYTENIFRIFPLANGSIFGTGTNYSGHFIYNPRTKSSNYLGKIHLSHYTTSLFGGKLYLSGYAGARLFEYDDTKSWTQMARYAPTDTIPKENDPKLNPRYVTDLNTFSGVHKMFASVVGANGLIYFGGRWYRDGERGGLAWYNPKNDEQGGISDIFSNYQIRYMTGLQNGKYIAISTMGVEDSVLNKETPTQGRIFIFDTTTKSIVNTIDPVPNSISSGKIISIDAENIFGITRVGTSTDDFRTMMYNVNIKTGELLYKMELPLYKLFVPGDNENINNQFIKGPEGMIWTVLKGVLVKIKPNTGEIIVVGKVPGNTHSLLFKDNNLFSINKDKIIEIEIEE